MDLHLAWFVELTHPPVYRRKWDSLPPVLLAVPITLDQRVSRRYTEMSALVLVFLSYHISLTFSRMPTIS